MPRLCRCSRRCVCRPFRAVLRHKCVFVSAVVLVATYLTLLSLSDTLECAVQRKFPLAPPTVTAHQTEHNETVGTDPLSPPPPPLPVPIDMPPDEDAAGTNSTTGSDSDDEHDSGDDSSGGYFMIMVRNFFHGTTAETGVDHACRRAKNQPVRFPGLAIIYAVICTAIFGGLAYVLVSRYHREEADNYVFDPLREHGSEMMERRQKRGEENNEAYLSDGSADHPVMPYDERRASWFSRYGPFRQHPTSTHTTYAQSPEDGANGDNSADAHRLGIPTASVPSSDSETAREANPFANKRGGRTRARRHRHESAESVELHASAGVVDEDSAAERARAVTGNGVEAVNGGLVVAVQDADGGVPAN